VAGQSKAWAAASRLLGLRVRFPPATWKHVSCECCVLSGGGVLQSTVSGLNAIAKPQQRGGRRLLGLSSHKKKFMKVNFLRP
jgi:hypothetical protein